MKGIKMSFNAVKFNAVLPTHIVVLAVTPLVKDAYTGLKRRFKERKYAREMNAYVNDCVKTHSK